MPERTDESGYGPWPEDLGREVKKAFEVVLAEFESKTSYTKDVGGIRVEWIVKTAVPAKVGKREIRAMALEGLIIAKYRAGRTQDIADLRQLMANRNQDIRWAVMSGIGTDLEITELRQTAKALGS